LLHHPSSLKLIFSKEWKKVWLKWSGNLNWHFLYNDRYFCEFQSLSEWFYSWFFIQIKARKVASNLFAVFWFTFRKQLHLMGYFHTDNPIITNTMHHINGKNKPSLWKRISSLNLSSTLGTLIKRGLLSASHQFFYYTNKKPTKRKRATLIDRNKIMRTKIFKNNDGTWLPLYKLIIFIIGTRYLRKEANCPNVVNFCVDFSRIRHSSCTPPRSSSTNSYSPSSFTFYHILCHWAHIIQHKHIYLLADSLFL